MGYIFEKLSLWKETGTQPEFESISIEEFLKEYDYATKYLSRVLKVRQLTLYLVLFKEAFFIQGKKAIEVNLRTIANDFLTDRGNIMTDKVTGPAMIDLIRMKIVEKVSTSVVGQANRYEIKLPSEIKEVIEFIEQDNDNIKFQENSDTIDFYKRPEDRVKILNRDEFACFYCLREINKKNFHLDHIVPKTDGGENFKSNLIATCSTCNTAKNSKYSAMDFLLNNYRKGLLDQKEFDIQREKLIKLTDRYNEIINNRDFHRS
jgi:hypothetical protein